MQTKNIGIILVILGIIMMIYTGFTFVTSKRVADIGPVKIDKEENHPVQWSPIVGGVLLIGGVILIASSSKKAG